MVRTQRHRRTIRAARSLRHDMVDVFNHFRVTSFLKETTMTDPAMGEQPVLPRKNQVHHSLGQTSPDEAEPPISALTRMLNCPPSGEETFTKRG